MLPSTNLETNINLLLTLAEKNGCTIYNRHNESCPSTEIPNGFDGVLTQVMGNFVEIHVNNNDTLDAILDCTDGTQILEVPEHHFDSVRLQLV